MSSTGMTTSISSGLEIPASTMATSRGVPGAAQPPRKRATSASGRWVADRPMRWGGVTGDLFEALERDGEVGATLGGGEGMDLVDDDRLDVDERVGGVRRQHQVQTLGRRDQQVGGPAQHRLTLLGRRVAGAHPDLGKVQPAEIGASRLAGEPFGRQGDAGQRRRRFFSTSKARARSGEMYTTRVRALRSSGGGVVTSRSIDHKKAASVLPLPVGAQISVCSPAAMGGQPSSWGSSARGRTRRTTPAPPAGTPPGPDDQRWFRG